MKSEAGRLVHKNNGKEVKIGDIVRYTRDDEVTEYEIMGWRKPHKPSSSGLVFVRVKNTDDFQRHYYPHVFDLEIVDYEASWAVD